MEILNKAQIDSIIREIEANSTGVKRTEAEFCEYWPSAKIILEILRKVPVLSIFVGIIIGVGDAYADKNCNV